MVPRTEISAVDIDDDLKNFANYLSKPDFPKCSFIAKAIDNIIGYVNSAELLMTPIL